MRDPPALIATRAVYLREGEKLLALQQEFSELREQARRLAARIDEQRRKYDELAGHIRTTGVTAQFAKQLYDRIQQLGRADLPSERAYRNQLEQQLEGLALSLGIRPRDIDAAFR